ncbi:hypothetical protein KEM55_001947, partial [Ascosphaera atra]
RGPEAVGSAPPSPKKKKVSGPGGGEEVVAVEEEEETAPREAVPEGRARRVGELPSWDRARFLQLRRAGEYWLDGESVAEWMRGQHRRLDENHDRYHPGAGSGG